MSNHSGGLDVTSQMADILAQPGFISVTQGGQTLRELYRRESLNMDISKLSAFTQAVFMGMFDVVKQLVEQGTAPDLSGTETPFCTGYASWVVLGAQRSAQGPPGSLRHLETLEFLLTHGALPDIQDILGHTALHHATTCPRETLDLTRCLLKHGANVNHLNRFGEISLFGTMQLNLVATIDILLEHGADIDIVPADGLTCRQFYLKLGPQVAAVMNKWIVKRSGGDALPRLDKSCDSCGKKPEGFDLKQCAKCRVARYCSRECQEKEWPTHKKKCKAFSSDATVVLKPIYGKYSHTIPLAETGRGLSGYPTQAKAFSKSQTRGSHEPKKTGKSLVVKVQVPFTDDPVLRASGLLVYSKTRDLACTINREDAPEEYDRISEVVRSKSITGAKGYFVAELESKDRLVVKISELLADQPW
ncbi:hypothetical protein MIND_01298200 [Mycena indigotica]|uniref:MYND-type domain-containing protein n=1 Tax=Mycena indigotica TaxID=2126181 RepID=A0A8H6VSR0_9AGAR|nr:uncharacterized protein MIND_01298200 [Mycena indigotica]KAF7290581.1 hypothetical protein MIND_01298200 [Mycena indigotica]